MTLPQMIAKAAEPLDVPHILPDLRAGRHDAFRDRLIEPKLERFIGVIERPETELFSRFAKAALRRPCKASGCIDEFRTATPPGSERGRRYQMPAYQS